MALILLGSVAGYVVYKVLHHYRVRRLIPKLTVQQVTDKIAAGETPVFIDLRPRGARQEVPSIPGSLPLSAEEAIVGHRMFPQDRDVILYCACPQDEASVQAAWSLREKGLTRVWPLAGGIEAWHAFDGEAGEAVRVSESQPISV
ncbi:MAG: hypothetical protein L0H94_08600 [Nitrospira sp.]|nr:hypothetical protein [Nitrospira sp.]